MTIITDHIRLQYADLRTQASEFAEYNASIINFIEIQERKLCYLVILTLAVHAAGVQHHHSREFVSVQLEKQTQPFSSPSYRSIHIESQ